MFFGIYFFRRDPRLRDRALGRNFSEARIHGFFGKSRGRDRKKYITKKSKKGPFGDVTFSNPKIKRPEKWAEIRVFRDLFFSSGPSTTRPAPRTKRFEGPNSRVFREKSGSRPKKIHCEKVEKRAFWGRDFLTIEKKDPKSGPKSVFFIAAQGSTIAFQYFKNSRQVLSPSIKRLGRSYILYNARKYAVIAETKSAGDA